MSRRYSKCVFEDLVSLSDNMQVIVLENKEPSDEVKEKFII